MGYLQAFVMLWPFFIHTGVWEVLAMDLKGHMGSVELYFLNQVLPSTVKKVLFYTFWGLSFWGFRSLVKAMKNV